MSEYSEFEREECRLQILRLLAADADYEANDTLIQRGLSVYGLNQSIQQIRADLEFLSQSACVHTTVMGGYYLAKLTRQGEDVAQGRMRMAGVARPRPD
jgi:hypothetical protein